MNSKDRLLAAPGGIDELEDKLIKIFNRIARNQFTTAPTTDMNDRPTVTVQFKKGIELTMGAVTYDQLKKISNDFMATSTWTSHNNALWLNVSING